MEKSGGPRWGRWNWKLIGVKRITRACMTSNVAIGEKVVDAAMGATLWEYVTPGPQDLIQSKCESVKLKMGSRREVPDRLRDSRFETKQLSVRLRSVGKN